ncbi:MAG TPA: metalloregulator ArsR/SmtB family transcription factor [Acidobacteriota bacterium]|nr:metalloregulator ArsR/SmtB family transcription factor [Acidobacteriota bacterium]
MVEYRYTQLDNTFHAVSDPTRRAILKMLSERQARVTEIAKSFPYSLNAISKHLKVLEQAGLIRREIKGRDHFCQLDPAPLQEASDWFAFYRQFWEERLDAMERHIIMNRKRRKNHARTSTTKRDNRNS